MANESTLLQLGDAVRYHYLSGHYFHRVASVDETSATLMNGKKVLRPIAENRDVVALDDEGVAVVLGSAAPYMNCLFHCRYAPEDSFTGWHTKAEFLAAH